MAGPWEKYAQQAESTPADAPWAKYKKKPVRNFDLMADGSLVPSESIVYAASGPVPASSGLGQRIKKYGITDGFDFSIKPENVRDVGRSLSPIARGAVKAVTALPGLAADAGVGLRNFFSGSQYEAPTQSMERSLDQYLPLPGTPGDKTLEFLTSVIGGAKLPLAPQVNNPVPSNFVKPTQDLIKQETLRQGREAGLVVPPSTTNPTRLNTMLESLGGKAGTAQDAALRNQDKFNFAAKASLGISDDTPLTVESLQAMRREAGNAYENLRGAGQIVADKQFADDLAAVTSKYRGAAKDFPELAKSEVDDLVAGVSKKEFSSDSAVDLLSILRDNTDKAFRAGNSGFGKAIKDVSKAIEELIQRRMTEAGKTDLVQKFKDARQLIAKTYTVEDAYNAGTGNVSGTNLGRQLNGGAPLSGDLRKAARFAQAFPKASNPVTDSGSVRNTDVILGAGAAGVSREPQWLMYPFVRQAVRSFLLSDQGQKLAIPGNGIAPSPEAVLRAILSAEQARKSAQ